MTNRKILFEQLHWNWRSRGNSNYYASLATIWALWCPRCWFFVVSCFSACHVALWLWSNTSVRFVFCSFLITWLLTHSASFSLFLLLAKPGRHWHRGSAFSALNSQKSYEDLWFIQLPTAFHGSKLSSIQLKNRYLGINLVSFVCAVIATVILPLHKPFILL